MASHHLRMGIASSGPDTQSAPSVDTFGKTRASRLNEYVPPLAPTFERSRCFLSTAPVTSFLRGNPNEILSRRSGFLPDPAFMGRPEVLCTIWDIHRVTTGCCATKPRRHHAAHIILHRKAPLIPKHRKRRCEACNMGSESALRVNLRRQGWFACAGHCPRP